MSDRPHADTVPRLADLSQGWRRRAESLRLFAEPVARAFELVADELDAAVAVQGGDLLTLTDAAAVCGFSPDHLGRLVRSGKVPNYGRPHAPRVRLADVPRKATVLPPKLERATLVGATRRELARAVASEQGAR